MIKNRKSSTSLAVNKIETKRRIILTGTPIQNNLKECKYIIISYILPFYLPIYYNPVNMYNPCMRFYFHIVKSTYN